MMILTQTTKEIRNLFLHSKFQECIEASKQIQASDNDFNSYLISNMYQILSTFEISEFEDAQQQFKHLIEERNQKKGEMVDQVDLLVMSFYLWELCDCDNYNSEEQNEELLKLIKVYESLNKVEDLDQDGIYHLALSMNIFIDNIQYDNNVQCLQFFEKAQKLNNEFDQEIKFLEGWMLDYLGKYEEAIQSQLNLYEQNKYFPSICNNMSVTYKNLGENEKKEQFLLQAEEIQQKNIVVLHNLAMHYHQKNEQEKVDEYFQRANQMYPNNSHTYLIQGLIYMAIGEHQKAFEAYQKGLQINPNDCDIYEKLSILEPENFQEYLQKCISLRPKKASYYLLLSERFYYQNQIDQCLNYLNQAQNCRLTDLQHIRIFTRKIMCFQALHNNEEALQQAVLLLEKNKIKIPNFLVFQISKQIIQIQLPTPKKMTILDSFNFNYLSRLDEFITYLNQSDIKCIFIMKQQQFITTLQLIAYQKLIQSYLIYQNSLSHWDLHII